MERTKMNTHLMDPDVMRERAEKISEIFEERKNGLSVLYNSVWKNNVSLNAFVIRSDDMNASPTIYPDEEMLSLSDEELADRLEEFHADHALNISLDMLMDRDYILQNVRPRLISEDTNIDGLNEAEIAYMPWKLGLLLTFYIPVPGFGDHDGSNATCQLKWPHLKAADLSVTELYDLAVEHVTKDMDFRTMREVLFGMLPEGAELPFPDETDVRMYVLSTYDKLWGAALLISDMTMKEISQRLGSEDWYLIFSSVHECIIIPIDSCSAQHDEQSLVNMICEINATEVAETDRLSDHLYAHSADGLRIVA